MPIISEPDRGAPLLEGIEKLTVPFPDPERPDVNDNQDGGAEIVHAHPAGAVTVTDPVPPATPKLALVPLSEYVHPDETITVESVALAEADPPPLTVTEFNWGDAAPGATLTITVTGG